MSTAVQPICNYCRLTIESDEGSIGNGDRMYHLGCFDRKWRPLPAGQYLLRDLIREIVREEMKRV